MIANLRSAATLVALFTLMLGLVYPLAMTGFAGAVFPQQAAGSLVERDGRIVGSALVGQAFSGPGYLHPRPSAAAGGYDASASGGSNLGPASARLQERLGADSAALQAQYGVSTIPADAATTSASGLDPHVSPQYARLQAARIAEARGMERTDVLRLIDRAQEGRTLGFLGEPRVNVLSVNLALDEMAAGRDGG
ncbi:K+-transporting ATPase ATPase C chain [Aureimonas altamirensis DSM 21988]|uniref:Potassium-transporting ATPase KdpC subunit n=2 Tax=Aureimonas altamirensis TaxID=370622 RepID=A0A0P0YXJ4_9HYPH|nr:potassium-transporting ATPase subunit KdpC [Aureimonas altamirensis]BAT26267.1 K+-transporting ATPase, C subunit [Aureimonas altamirensis]SHJ42630.1 K+-transporting ATPase ATPase C chain [Aureimonas altamirensis DSM 21988]